MRENLFKAKRKDNGEWVEGFVFEFKNKFYITEMAQTFMTAYYTAESVVDFNMRAYEIKPDTLCQYTGLPDKNGRKIWENDIVNCFESECCGKISWNESEAGFYFDALLEDGTYEEECVYDYADCMDVIGSIFDNPELLEVE